MKYIPNFCYGILGIAMLLVHFDAQAVAQDDAAKKEKPAAAATQEKDSAKAETKEQPKKKATSIAGEWAIKSGSRSGAEIPKDRLTAISINDKEITIPAGPDKFVMSYKLNTDKSPFEVDMKIESGPVPDGAAKGIVLLNGNTMKLCYNGMGGERPEKFETAEGDNCFYFELEKVQPKLTKKALLGTWTITEGKRAGQKSAADRIAGDIVFSEEKIQIGEGDAGFTMSYELDLEKSPAEIDMKVTAGPAPVGSPASGIVRIDADGNLHLCYDGMGGPRPEKFESTEENNCFLFTLKKKE